MGRAITNGPPPPPRIYGASFFAWVKKVWLSRKPAQRPILRVSGGWEIGIWCWTSSGITEYRPFMLARDFNLVIAALVRCDLQRILVGIAGREGKFRALRYKPTFQLYCATGHREPSGASRIFSRRVGSSEARGGYSPDGKSGGTPLSERSHLR